MMTNEFSNNFKLNCIAVANKIIATKKPNRQLIEQCENVEQYNSKVINKNVLNKSEFEYLKLFFEKIKEW